MEKQILLNAHGFLYNLAANTFCMIASAVNKSVDGLGTYYSQVLERNINRQQTWALIEAQAALFLGILPAGYSLLLRAAALVWFFVAVKRCKRML
ncbi:MAG: hypothetical protein IJ604_06520 [Prevotella sp.]|nr:hypothetical protein [Prevotella sp.]MBR1463019.1 hypothetical protein [Prevotella sp.]